MQNNLYRNLLEQSTDYIFIVNAQGIIDLVSVGLEKVTGYTREELIGQPVEILVPERFQNHIQLRDNYIAKPKARQMGTGRELVVRRKDGSEFPVEISLNSLKTEQGLIVSAIIIDITERKQAVEVLQEEQQHIRAVIDVPTDMIYVKDIDGRFILVNPTLANYFGRTVAEIIGKTNADLFPTEERARQSEIEDREILSTGKSFDYERTEEIKGNIRTRITTKSPYRNAEGKIIGVIGLSRDITERKQSGDRLQKSEEKYRQLVEDTNVLSWEADIKTVQFTYMSPQSEKITGFTPERWCQPNFWEQHIYSEDKEWAMRFCKECTDRLEDHTFEYRLVKADGNIIWFHDNVKIIYDEQGTPTALRGVMIDITEQKLAEDALQQYKHIIDSTSDIMAYIDANYVYQAVNQKYLEAYQKTHDEVIGHHLIDTIGEDYFESFAQENINRCIAGESFNYQVWRDYPNLGERCMDISYSPYKDFKGDITGAVLSIRDITEQKLAEESLRLSEERFDLAVKGTTDGFWDRDLENEKSWWASRFYELLGYQDGEIEATHQNFADKLHPEDKDRFHKALHAHLEDRVPFALEHRIQTKSGEYRWFNARGQALWDEQGKAVRMAGSIQDITERKQAEESLRLQSEITLNLAEGIYLIRMDDGEIVYTNPRFENIFGYGPRELLGKHVSILNAPTNKSPRETASEIIAVLHKTGEWHGEIKNIKKDGTLFWCYVNVSVFDHTQYGEVLVAVLTDITERKQVEDKLRQSEKRYRGLLESAPDGMVIVNAQGEIEMVSHQLQKMTGYTLAELVGQPMEVLIPERFKDHKQQRDSYLEGPRLRMMGEGLKLFVRRKDGSEFPAAISLSPLETDEGLIVSAAVRDITERKQVEAEIEQHRHHLEELVGERTASMKDARDEAERANAAKSDFLSHMSHELRTPMNAILGFGQLLQMDTKDLNETQRANVQEILDAGYHLLNLINDVLDLAKIESGKLDITVEEVHVNDVLQQCITMVSTQAEVRQIELIDHISDKGYTVKADFTRLTQVLLNLLTNAVKYNREHGRITIDGEIIDKQRLRIRVTDTGKGLREADIAKLFTSFERLDKVHNIEGTGIGLVISKHMIELMGGSIGVDSTPGEGSTFWVELTLFNDESRKPPR